MNPDIHARLTDPRISSAVEQLREIVRCRYPEARFDVGIGEDPSGVYLTILLDTEDTTTVLDAVADRLFEIQVEQGLPIYVVPMRSAAKVLENAQLGRVSRSPQPRLSLGDVYGVG